MNADRRGRRGGGRGSPAAGPARKPDYRRLRNPFPPVPVFSDDRVAAIHDTALRVLEELGMKVLLPEAIAYFRAAGAIVDPDTQMVRIGRDIVERALETAPPSFEMQAGSPEKNVLMELGSLAIQTGGGAPHATDLVRGRRPGSLIDFEEIIKLTHAYDVLHMLNPAVEPQDVPTELRHYATTRAQLRHSDKVPFIFSRGTQQVTEAWEMIRIGRGLSEDAFFERPRCFTIINTNSPRTLDIPMAQGIIDFARAGQLMIVTPFCLMGAMAPVTPAGALTLSHAEALAAITLSQTVRPGAPVCYGAFASNVDMKSGAPAFGTPEQVKSNLGAGQLARHVGLPWRCAAGCAANVNDAQAAHETQMSAWGAILAGCTVLIHGAGWIEGGLTVSWEKIITDLEMLQIFAELCSETESDDDAIGFEALAEVDPGGHFFAAAHTMERYKTAFYEPMVYDWSNFGTWTERGALDASTRATSIWQAKLAEAEEAGFELDDARSDELDAYVAKCTEAGGAPPTS